MGEAPEPAFHGIALRGLAFAGGKETAPQPLSGALGFPPRMRGLSSGDPDCPPQAAIRQASRAGRQAGEGLLAVFSLETEPNPCSALDGRRALAV